MKTPELELKTLRHLTSCSSGQADCITGEADSEDLLYSTTSWTASASAGGGLNRERSDGQLVISESTLFLGCKIHQNTIIISAGAGCERHHTSCSSEEADGITGEDSLLYSTTSWTASASAGGGLNRERSDGQLVISESTLFLGCKIHQNTIIISAGAGCERHHTSCSSEEADGITGEDSLIKEFN